MNKKHKLFAVLIVILSFFSICQLCKADVVDTVYIKKSTSRITGKIIRQNNGNNDSVFVNINLIYAISGGYIKYKALVDKFGRFSIDADVETNISLVSMNISIDPEKYLLVKLKAGSVTNVEITYNLNNKIANIDIKPAMNKYDITHSLDVVGKMIDHRSGRMPEPLHEKSTDYFLNYTKNILSERLGILNKDKFLSKNLKELLSKDFRLFLYNAHVFNYERQMLLNYRYLDTDQTKKPTIKKVDKSYFHFLKDFNLNDPKYLNCFTFPEVQKEILQNQILGLPAIEENDISSWLANVKAILSNLIGFKDGQYYDILAANAYGRQLNEELRPLSDKQKENITKYWKNGEIAKILFRKNDQVVGLDKFKSPAVINEISSIPDDKVMETIISKYTGKVIFIDLWATWCSPCLDDMQQFRTTKNTFHDKAVVFVYLTNNSSPRMLWEEKIKGIGNEHYYLTSNQWEYIMKHFDFQYIPSYILYNKEGVLVNKFQAFPGNEKVRDMINSAL
ncbi:TlpA family protein disulfide reductase [Pedobacter sp. BG31]|uniref:TlpA family protein disulfide reductase n=1 Tax=Pedobacter sp. BG31 TaxID=3349697 RepID=UPI0035F480D3